MLRIKFLRFITFLIFNLLFCQLSVFSQDEISRRKIPDFPNVNFGGIKTWADDNGYVLVGLQYTQQVYSFYLYHRVRGELTNFTGKLLIKEAIGFTSTNDEFTLYFKGLYNGKSDDYFISFSKEGRKLAIVSVWADAPVKDDRLLQYSAFNKLYLITKKKDQFSLVEVEKYGQFKIRPIAIEPELKKLLNYNVRPMFPAMNDRGNKTAKVKFYPFPDSLVVFSELDNSINEKCGTEFYTINYSTGKSTFSQLVYPIYGSSNSLVIRDRLYQLIYGFNFLSLRIYRFPTAQLLHEFKYNEDDSITIQSSPLMREDGERKDENWDPEKLSKRTLKFLIKGDPYLEGEYAEELSILHLGSHHISGGGTMPMAGGGTMHIPTNIDNYYIKVSIDADKIPAPNKGKINRYDQILTFEQALRVRNIKEFQFIETATDLYCVSVDKKSNEVIITSFTSN